MEKLSSKPNPSKVRPPPARPPGYFPVPRLGQNDDEEVDEAYQKDEAACERHHQDAVAILANVTAPPDELEEALIRLQRAIFLRPKKPELFITRAEAFLRVGDVTSAITDMRRAVQLNPRDVIQTAKLAFYLDFRGQQWLQMQQFEMAVAFFKEAVQLYTYYWPFRLHLALAYVSINELDPALEAVSSALDIAQEDRDLTAISLDGKSLEKVYLPKAEMFILRGKILWAKGNVGLSVQDFGRAEQLDPQHGEVQGFVNSLRSNASDFFRAALRQMAQGDYQAAVVSLSTALDVVPDDVKTLLIRAAALRKLHQYEDALDDLRTASMGYWESMQGKPYPNKELLHPSYRGTPFKEPVVLTRQRNLVLNEIAVELAISGKFQDAVTLLNKVIEEEREVLTNEHGPSRPGDVDHRFLVNRGDCHRALDNIDLAIADYHRAHEQRPSDWQISTRLSLLHYMIGTGLYNSGEWDRSAESLSLAIKYNNKVAAFYLIRGKVHYYRSEFGLSFMDYHEALKLDPANVEARRLLKQFASSDQEFKEADLKLQAAGIEPLGQPETSSGPPPAMEPPALRKLRARALKEKKRAVGASVGLGDLPLKGVAAELAKRMIGPQFSYNQEDSD